jgi:hypothetical protein
MAPQAKLPNAVKPYLEEAEEAFKKVRARGPGLLASCATFF